MEKVVVAGTDASGVLDKKKTNVNQVKSFGKQIDGSITEPLSWEDLVYLIDHGLFNNLGRSASEIVRYRQWREAIVKVYESPLDYIASVLFNQFIRLNDKGVFQAVKPECRRERYALRENDFPYFLCDGIRHFVLWAESGFLSTQIIEKQIEEHLPNYPYIYFVNLPELQSVKLFQHCHIFLKEPDTPQTFALEVCVDSVASAIEAQNGGADRLELCCALAEGGLTPTLGMVKAVLDATHIPVYALVRPRGGDFLYSDVELKVMFEDITQFKACGVHGFVIGVLTAEGDIDIGAMQRLMSVCSPVPVTFHRAFDMVRDFSASLDTIASLGGVSRVLTSGGQSTALEGAPTLRKLQMKAQLLGIIIMAGGGVTQENVSRILRDAGVTEVHASARTTRKSGMQFCNTNVHMSSALHNPEFTIKQTSATIVSSIRTKMT